MDKKALIEERVKLFEANKAALEKAASEKRTLTGEEQKHYDERDARVTEIRATLERIEKTEAEERALGESRGRQTETATVRGEQRDAEAIAKDKELAFRAWALGNAGEGITDEMRAACDRIKFNPTRREVRALSTGTTDAGGYSVPDDAMRAFWEKQKWYGPIRSLATILRTSSGAALPVPTVDDTASAGEIIGEGSAVTTTQDPVFGQVVFNAYKYSSKAVIVSVEMLQDSQVPLASYLGGALGTRIGRIQNTHFTTGDDSSKPNGVVTAASLGKTAAATNAITFDEIIDTFHAVDLAYRNRPGAGFMMNDGIAAAVRKLKDSNNQYIWQMSVQDGEPDRLLGKPVYINNDMQATLAATKKVLLYGDFSLYHIRDAGEVVFARADELRILNHQVVFLAFQRSDGDLLDTGAVKYLLTAT